MLPPLALMACISAIKEVAHLGATLHTAEGEADAYCVALAARLGGYVAGNDSDYLVLNAPGYHGYVPFDSIQAILKDPAT